MAKRFVVSDWAWSNILKGDNAPRNVFVSCYFEHDYAIDKADYKIYDTVIGDVVRETAKAVCIEVLMKCFNHRSDLTGKTFKWRYWIPKSQIIEGDFFYAEYYQMAKELIKFYKEVEMSMAV